jgi:hypothetical protein
MKIQFDRNYYSSMFNLGIEFWLPKHSHWVTFQITLCLGPWVLEAKFGSKKRFDDIAKLLRGDK